MTAFGEYTLTFALERETRALRHVREVKTGQACGCVCPGCGEPLEAVNAQAAVYKKRPHFRHLEGQNSAECSARSIAKAAEAALAEVRSIQLPPITPQSRTLFDEAPPEKAPTEIERFELIDHTEGLLHLPDGRALRVRVIARFTGGKELDGDFDLTLDLSRGELDNCQNLGNLRNYLTLDSSCWRWCQRQTKPTMLPEELSEGALETESVVIVPVPAQQPVGSANKVRIVSPPPKEPALARSATSPIQPVQEWTEPPVKFKDGTVLLFHRKRWPNGVMTEIVERLSPDPLDR